MNRVAAIVPAHNEQERVAATVRSLRASGRLDEIVVVDDGSTDATAERAIEAGARVIRLPRNRGKGAAVEAGIRGTDAAVVLLCDADLGESAAALTALLDPVLTGDADMAIAAPPRGRPSGFGAVESFARWGIARAAGIRTARPLSGQRAVRRDALPATLAGGFGLEVGLTIDAVRGGRRVVEVPIAFTHTKTGRDVAGFTHRARQGLAVARVLSGRLRRRTPSPARREAPR